MASYDDLDNKNIFALSAVFVAVSLLTIFFVVWIFNMMQEGELDKKMFNTEYTQFNAILDEQEESLSSYVVVDPDPETRRYGVPIEQAIDAVIAESEDEGNSDET